MNLKKTKVMLIGHDITGNLESSYQRACEALNYEVIHFDILAKIGAYTRLGRLGKTLNQFIPVEPWVRKANRDFVVEVIKHRVDVVITFGHYPIRVGSLAQIKAATSASLVHIWPDTMLNWDTHLTSCLPLFDCLATYSQTTVPVFKKLGCERAIWVPLAGDPSLHATVNYTADEQEMYNADITFIGGWRPEREATLSKLSDFSLKIWGPDWGRRCKRNPVIMNAWQGRGLFGTEFAKAVACSKINLNIIDPTNYPAANMRFFEVLIAGGLELSSPCPELENEFRDGEHIFYFRCEDNLPNMIQALLQNDEMRKNVATAGQAKVAANHTYAHRILSILDYCQNEAAPVIISG